MAGTSSSSPDHNHRGERSSSPVRNFARDLWTQIKHRPLRSTSIIGAISVAVVLLGYGSQHLSRSRAPGKGTAALLKESLGALEAGQITAARNIAAELRLHGDIPKQERGIPPFVLGVAMHEDAKQDWQPSERKALFLLAARYFDEARLAGFPAGQETRGLYLLGKSWHEYGRHAEAIPHLLAASAKAPANLTEIHRLLTSCYLNDKVPNLAQAAHYNQLYLSDPRLPTEDRDEAVLTQARILFELQRLPECQQILESLSPETRARGEALLLAGRLQLRAGDEVNAQRGTTGAESRDPAADKYKEAMTLFQRAIDSGDRTSEFQRKAHYLLGVALRRLEDYIAAEEQFSRTRRAYADSAEGIASGVEAAELQHLLGNDEEALQTFQQTLRHAAELKIHGTPWLSRDEIRSRVERTADVYQQEERFAVAADLINSLLVLFPDGRTTELQATVHEAWARHLLKKAETPGESDSSALTTQARSEFRQAGHSYEQLAQKRFATREYVKDLWNSAENYLNGQDYHGAVRLYRRFLEQRPRTGRPAALVRLGTALLALNQPQQAVEMLDECIKTFSKDPFIYEARLTAAAAQLELGKTDAAKQLLLANLENDSLTPQSREWRESLFLLGRILYREGVEHETRSRAAGIDSSLASERQEGLKELRLARTAFRECARRLSEAVQREPESPHALESRYMIAQAHLQSAKLPKKEMAGVTVETTRVMLRREMQQDLAAAAEAFEDLKTRLNLKQEQTRSGLTAVEQRMLRNCYFGRADTLFDLDQYEAALEAYGSASNRYQHEPEALEAYVQIANCYRKLRKPADSRRTIDQAKAVLNRIRPEADFLATTRYDRQEWTDLLNWLSTM